MNIIRSFLRYREIQNTKNDIFRILGTIDFSVCKNVRPLKIQKIAMLIPTVYPNLGGITSALRILTYIQNNGIETTIVLSSKSQDIESARRNVKLCMRDFEGNVKTYEESLDIDFDICIATSWQTVYYAKKLRGYKVYFVQDYEPDFYETNDFSMLAKATYTQGFHIISLGKWNVDKIRKNIRNSDLYKMDYIEFPYDKSEYKFDDRDYLNYANKKTLKIACYIRFIGRRIPYICEYLLSNTKNELKKYGYNLEIDKRNKFSSGINLGKLSRNELYRLYCNSDFGMVASMSNISLVPYEMLASGLPVVEFRDGSYPYFLGLDTALLINCDYKELANGILELVNNTAKLKHMHESAMKKLELLSWDSSCEQFYKILLKTICNTAE